MNRKIFTGTKLVAVLLLSIAASVFFVVRGAADCMSPGIYHVSILTPSIDNSHCWSVMRWPGFRRYAAIKGPPGWIGGDGLNWRYEPNADPPAWAKARWRQINNSHRQISQFDDRAIGFPLVCVSATRVWSVDFDVALVNGFLVPDTLQPPLLSRSAGELTRTALQVLGCMNWFAFAVNTLFFGAVFSCAMFLWSWPGRWRRNGRLRRGECLECRYPIPAGAAQCPECGNAIKSN